MQAMEKEVPGAMLEKSSSQMPPLPFSSPSWVNPGICCPWAACGRAPAPGWPHPGPLRHPWEQRLGVMAVGRNARGGIPGNWFYPSVRCRRDGGWRRSSSLGEGI